MAAMETCMDTALADHPLADEAAFNRQLVGCNGMNFRENEQGCHILQKLHIQRNKGQYCDVTFHIDSHQVLAHSCVLAASSPYFEYEFSKAEVSNSIHHHVSNHCLDTFQHVIDFIYTGTVLINRENVGDLLKLSNQYMIQKLKAYCSEYLERNLTTANCYLTKAIAEACHLPPLMKKAESFIIANLSDIILQEEVLSFADHIFESVISNKSMPLTEEMRFSLLVRWIQHDFTARQAKLPVFLQHIQWEKVNVLSIYTIMRDSAIFRESKWCMFIMLQNLDEKKLLSPIHLPTLDHLRSLYSKELISAGQTSNSVVTESAVNTDACNPLIPEEEDDDSMEEICMPDMDESDSEQNQEETTQQSNDQSPNSTHAFTGLNVIASLQVDTQQTNEEDTSLKIRIPKSKIVSTRKRRTRRSGIVDPEEEEQNMARLEQITKIKMDPKHKQLPKIKCPKCDFTAKDRGRIERHFTKAHNEDSVQECSICNYKSSWNREFYKHMKVHFPGPPFHCDQEGCEWSGERIQQLLTHRMTHNDERPHACEKCNMKFRSRNNLMSHMKCHSGDKPHTCDECGRSFATKGTLDQHRVTHSTARPYLCDTCGFSTKYQSHLIAHRRIHSGDVYSCQYPNCKYSTPKRSQLACHMRSHLSIRTHICSTCGRGFVERGHLVRHERIHLDAKPFACSACDYSSTRRDKLKEHMAKYHAPDATGSTPYKARKPRKRGIEPGAYPTVNAEQAQAELDAKMKQASDIADQVRKAVKNNAGEVSVSTLDTSAIEQEEGGMLASQLRGTLQLPEQTMQQQQQDLNVFIGIFGGMT